MKINLIIILSFLICSDGIYAAEDLKYYINKAINNNLKLNAERKNFESAKQNKNISRSEFLPSLSVSRDQISTTSTNRRDQNGLSLADSNTDTESTTISLEQKIFTGFKGINTFKNQS